MSWKTPNIYLRDWVHLDLWGWPPFLVRYRRLRRIPPDGVFWVSWACSAIAESWPKPSILQLFRSLWKKERKFEKMSYALSFYRSQNVLGWSKFFVPDQNFCAWQKDYLHSVKLVFVPTQKFWTGTNPLSFYRFQNVLCWSKFFEPDQNFIYILCQSQTFCVKQKDHWHSVKLVFVPA